MNKNFTYSLFSGVILTVVLSSCGAVYNSTPRGSSSGTSSNTKNTRSNSNTGSRVLESGVASWYGPKFNGRATANGETYNMDDLTAAHKTLPFNTLVRVENINNGKSVIVRINDRGPYVDNRIIDLSRKAAETVDMIGSGTANVRILFVEEGDRPLTAHNTSSRETFTVQLASFNTESEAKSYSAKINGTRVEHINSSGKSAYRVYYGSYKTSDDARRAQRMLSNQGYNGFAKQVEN